MDESIETTLSQLLNSLGMGDSRITRSEIAGQIVFAVETPDDRAFVGNHADAVHALDHLVKKITEKKIGSPRPEHLVSDGSEPERLMFLVDIGGHRTKQIKDLQTKALMMAERARSFQYDVELSPMSSYERLIVHTTLQDAPHVKTESQGDGRNRRVVIKYAA
jgi:spoIIIJ-associated protein